MNKKILFSFMIGMLFLFSISMVYALCELEDAYIGSFAQNSEINLWQTCPDCSFVNISQVTYPNSSVALGETVMQQNGTSYTHPFNLTSSNGQYVYKTFGNSSSNGVCTQNIKFDVTPSGRSPSDNTIFAYIILFFFLLIIISLFYYVNKSIDYERWYDSIIARYESKNTIKVIISSIGYNSMKNSFIWYYLFGLPIILLITDITYSFGVESMIELMKIILGIYWFGFILVGVFFFGFLQEWVMQIREEIKSLDYGV